MTQIAVLNQPTLSRLAKQHMGIAQLTWKPVGLDTFPEAVKAANVTGRAYGSESLLSTSPLRLQQQVGINRFCTYNVENSAASYMQRLHLLMRASSHWYTCHRQSLLLLYNPHNIRSSFWYAVHATCIA